MKAATWIIRDRNYYQGLDRLYPEMAQIMLTSQNLVYHVDLSGDKDLQDKKIKLAKREIIMKLLEDMLETENWFEDEKSTD